MQTVGRIEQLTDTRPLNLTVKTAADGCLGRAIRATMRAEAMFQSDHELSDMERDAAAKYRRYCEAALIREFVGEGGACGS